jgi:hypothetical protein
MRMRKQKRPQQPGSSTSRNLSAAGKAPAGGATAHEHSSALPEAVAALLLLVVVVLLVVVLLWWSLWRSLLRWAGASWQ